MLSSLVWRQDHNGFSHQDPGFIDHVLTKKPDIVRVYLPFDANTLLSTYDHCLRSAGYINVVVAGKQPAPQWLTMDEAVKHCSNGIGSHRSTVAKPLGNQQWFNDVTRATMEQKILIKIKLRFILLVMIVQMAGVIKCLAIVMI